MIQMQEWEHVFKLDPDKFISDNDLEKICESSTDALIVGGSSGVTFDNTIELLGRVRRYVKPCVLEVSNADAIVPGFDHYLLPFILNASDSDWIIKPHQQAVKQFGTMIPWQDVSVMGYCVLNPDSTVAKMTGSDTDISVLDVVAYARVARHVLRMPVFYIEYSGTYAHPEDVQSIKKSLGTELDNLQLVYGGGIDSAEKAQEMSRHVRTIVVGNVIYNDIDKALSTTQIKTEQLER